MKKQIGSWLALLIVLGLLGHAYLPKSILYNRFTAWEIAAIMLALLINLNFYRENKTWQIPFYITEREDEPFKYAKLFFFSIFLLSLALLSLGLPIVIGDSVKKLEDLLTITRQCFILLGSLLLLLMDKRVLKVTKDARLKLQKERKGKRRKGVVDARLSNKMKSFFKLKETTKITHKQIDGFLEMLLNNFHKSYLYNDWPVVVGFSMVVVNIGTIKLGVLENCKTGEIGIWVSGAAAFQLIASGLIFLLIGTEISNETEKLRRDYYGTDQSGKGTM